jgi:2-oxoglutarate ferredoxin oxidoreductase subunit delta
MPTPIIDKDRCKGCELCVHACPENVLEMSGDINAKGYFYPVVPRVDDCNGCRYCLLVCPDTAVQVENKGKTTVRTDGLTQNHTTYCPGCTHGVIHRLVVEVLSPDAPMAVNCASVAWALPCSNMKCGGRLNCTAISLTRLASRLPERR